MPTNSYDLIVLGDDLGALVCATLCARRGLRTLLLGEERPARYTLGPHKLPIEPAMWPAPGASTGDRVLKELHAELALRRKSREPKIAAQMVAPDLRIDLGVDRLAGELERELGKAGGGAWLARWEASTAIAHQLDPMLGTEHAFPPVGFFERRELAKLAERAHADASSWWNDAKADPHAALWRPLAAVAHRHPEPSPIAIARAVDAWRSGPVSLRGDGDTIRELFLEKLTTAGGEARAGRITEIAVSWGKVTSITLASGDELGTAQVVASKPPSELVELLGKKAPKRMSELAEGVALVGHRYTLNVVIDQAGLPEHMAPTVAVIGDPAAEPFGANAFTIHLGDPDDTGRVIATIATLLPAETGDDRDRLIARCGTLRGALWRRLDEIMPFFERHLVLAHSPFEAAPPQVPGGGGSYDVPKHLPLAMTRVWSGRAESLLDGTAHTGALTYTTGLKNLTLTGEQVLPALGVEGALVSGWSAAKVACAIAGKKKDYLQNEVVGAA
ncbi:MAG: hypothetical protein AB7O24_09965 [Kofleriaceae bacterium]